MTETTWKLVREVWLKNVIFIFIVALGMAFFKQRIGLIAGLCVGSFAAMLNFLIIAWNGEKILDIDGSFVFSFTFFYLVRMGIAAGIILLGIRYGAFFLFSSMLGLFSVRLSMTISTILHMAFHALKKKQFGNE